MKYNTKTQAIEAIKRLQQLIDREAIVEITEKKKSKSVSQNAYLHAILSMAAIHFGLTLDEVKQVMKHSAGNMVSYGWIIRSVRGFQTYRSIATFNNPEINLFIEHVRNFSQTHDCYLPTPMEYKQNKIEYDNEITKQKQYL